MQDPLSIDSVFRLVSRKEVTPTVIYLTASHEDLSGHYSVWRS